MANNDIPKKRPYWAVVLVSLAAVALLIYAFWVSRSNKQYPPNQHAAVQMPPPPSFIPSPPPAPLAQLLPPAPPPIPSPPPPPKHK